MANNDIRVTLNSSEIEKQILNNRNFLNAIKNAVAEPIKREVESDSHGAKFDWFIDEVKTGDRTAVVVASKDVRASYSAYFHGYLFNAAQRRRGDA